ncbi:MAG: hypothetical protein IIY02_00780 [Firmicutes bacterium]|nr:hypothetical protein [Bacillota bacterium]
MAQIIPICDFTLPGTAVYASLTERQLLRDDLFVAESPEVIRLALQGGMKPISFLYSLKRSAKASTFSTLSEKPAA